MWNLGLIPSANGLDLLDMKDCNNPKCQIRWVDKDGKPTPDNDDAIVTALAKLHNWLKSLRQSFGAS